MKQQKNNKNKDLKKSRPNYDNSKRSDFSSLNSQLGSFDLEPPKIYRNSQRNNKETPIRNNNYNRQQTKRKNNSSRKNSSSKNSSMSVNEQRKKQNSKRKTKSKARKILVGIITVLVMLSIFVVLCLTVLFKVDTINITGNKKYTKQQIQSVITIENGSNLILADKDKCSDKLEQSLPYIYSVDITKKLPSTIEIKVNEVPKQYAIKNKDSTYLVLDNNFKVMELSSKSVDKSTIIIKKLYLKSSELGEIAEFNDNQTKEDLLNMVNVISKLQLKEITAIYSTDINNNFMVYDNRIVFKLGSTDNLESKVYSALAATEKLNDSNSQCEGDLTVTDDKDIYFTEKR